MHSVDYLITSLLNHIATFVFNNFSLVFLNEAIYWKF